MDFISNINGLNQDNNWKPKLNKLSVSPKKAQADNPPDDESQITAEHKFKDRIIDLQENVKSTQEQINILNIASETLGNISQELSAIRTMASDTINSLNSDPLTETIEKNIDNIEKLGKLAQQLEQLRSGKDKNYDQMIQEYNSISDLTVKMAKIQGFEKELNANGSLDSVLSEINTTLDSVSSTKDSIESIKGSLITSIQSLNITLENVLSSHSRIRSVEMASERVQITRNQILNEAIRSISIQVKQPDADIKKLIG